mgnify:CR=1 FL=1
MSAATTNVLAGVTDSDGFLKCISAVSTENPGDNARGDGPGATDSKGNLLCKAYA